MALRSTRYAETIVCRRFLPTFLTRGGRSTQAQKNLGLDVDSPTPQDYGRTVLIPGVVLSIKARPGDPVQAGVPLFALQLVSDFFQATQSDLTKAARERF